MTAPNVHPIQLKEYSVKQSKYEIAPKLPTRSMLVGPSGTGKTVLLTNMILDIYTNLFSRIYIWSPSINVDKTGSGEGLRTRPRQTERARKSISILTNPRS